MKVGFTGTREGLTAEQSSSLLDWANSHPWSEFHHGACVGADAEAMEQFERSQVAIVGQVIHSHPSNLYDLTDQYAATTSAVRHKPKPPLARNRDIVDACEVLLACPKGPEEQRSGTWATVRYARKKGRKIFFFWPDGSTQMEQP